MLLYAYIFELPCYSGLTDNVSRIAYENLTKNLAENMAVVSSGFKDLSSRISTIQTVSTPTETDVPVPPIATALHSDPFDDLDLSEPSNPIRQYIRRPLPQLDRKDYKDVSMWTADEYSRRKGGRRGGEDALEEGSGPAALSSYMEDENGNDLPQKEKDSCRARARKFWNELLGSGRAPTCWGDLPQDAEDEFVHILETEFPWIRLCDDHWKAKRIGTNHYSQWYGKALQRKLKKEAERLAAQKAAMEAAGLDVDHMGGKWALKRPSNETDDDVPGPSKRVRDELESRSPSPPRPKLTWRSRKRKQVSGEDDVPGPSKRIRVEEPHPPSPRPTLTRRTKQGKQVCRRLSGPLRPTSSLVYETNYEQY